MINISNAIVNGLIIHRGHKNGTEVEWDYSTQTSELPEEQAATDLLDHLTSMYKEPLFFQLGTLGPLLQHPVKYLKIHPGYSKKVFTWPVNWEILFRKTLPMNRF